MRTIDPEFHDRVVDELKKKIADLEATIAKTATDREAVKAGQKAAIASTEAAFMKRIGDLEARSSDLVHLVRLLKRVVNQ